LGESRAKPLQHLLIVERLREPLSALFDRDAITLMPAAELFLVAFF